MYKKFFSYCEQSGVNLLLEDMIYIKVAIRKITLNVEAARNILFRYHRIYKENHKLEHDEIKKDNAARRAANNFLTDQVDKS